MPGATTFVRVTPEVKAQIAQTARRRKLTQPQAAGRLVEFGEALDRAFANPEEKVREAVEFLKGRTR